MKNNFNKNYTKQSSFKFFFFFGAMLFGIHAIVNLIVAIFLEAPLGNENGSFNYKNLMYQLIVCYIIEVGFILYDPTLYEMVYNFVMK